MKNSFTLEFMEFSFIIPKNTVEFINGYGIVKAYIDEEQELIGIVDKNYKEILALIPVCLIPKFFIAHNDNFIFVGYNNDLNKYQVWHINEEELMVNLGANDFLELDNKIIQLYYDQGSALYDTQSGEFITVFNYIGPFVYSEKYGYKVARASFYIEDDDHKIVNEVSTIINIRGEILENYYDLASGIVLETKDSDVVLDLVRKKGTIS